MPNDQLTARQFIFDGASRLYPRRLLVDARLKFGLLLLALLPYFSFRVERPFSYIRQKRIINNALAQLVGKSLCAVTLFSNMIQHRLIDRKLSCGPGFAFASGPRNTTFSLPFFCSKPLEFDRVDLGNAPMVRCHGLSKFPLQSLKLLHFVGVRLQRLIIRRAAIASDEQQYGQHQKSSRFHGSFSLI